MKINMRSWQVKIENKCGTETEMEQTRDLITQL